jgi:DNA-binding SARP family transcriptional activator/tetratricopeptide (TPR) repeat protein
MTSTATTQQSQVQLFGVPSLIGPFGPIDVSPQQLILLVLVFGHAPSELTRADVARFLWERNADSIVRHRIRQLVSGVRSRTSLALVESDGEWLRPARDTGSELSVFRAALTNGDMRGAAQLLRSGFARLAFGHTDTLEDWRLRREEELTRELRVEANARLNSAISAGQWTRARDAAEGLYAIDPADASVVKLLIDVLGRLGERERAERVFAAFQAGHRASLDEVALVLEAMSRTRRLEDRDGPQSNRRERVAPLIGRGDVLQRAKERLEGVRRGNYPIVLITGESGIGKTRVLEEACRNASFDGFQCLRAQAVEPESRIPLSLLLDSLKSLDLSPYLAAIGPPWDAVVAGMLPAETHGSLRVTPPTLSDEILVRRLFDAFALLFDAIARAHPTILFIDDLQWADETTVSALQFMRRRWKGGAFGLVATVRTDPGGSLGSALRLLSPRNSGDSVTQLEVGELTPADARELVACIGSGEIDPDCVQRIVSLAGTHPLFLTELSRDFLASRRLPQASSEVARIPLSLRHIIDARLDALKLRDLRIIHLLAVAAGPLEVADISLLSDVDSQGVVDSIESLRRARLIDCEFGRVWIRHDLFRVTAYQRLSDTRRAVLHRAMANHLRCTEGHEAAGTIATHYSRAGERALASRFGWIAATRAMRSGAVDEAAYFFQMVSDSDVAPDRRANATAACARALFLSRNITRADPLLEVGAARLRLVGKVSEAARLEVRRIEGLAELGTVPLQVLLERLEQVSTEARARSDWEVLALGLDADLQLRHRVGDVQGINRTFGEMRLVSRVGSREAQIIAHAGLALGVLFGDPDEAVDAARRAVELATQGRSYRLKSLLRLMVALQCRGMLAGHEYRMVSEEIGAAAATSGDTLVRFSIENNLAVAALDSGDLDRAETLMSRVHDLAGDAEMTLNRLIHSNNAAEIAMARGEWSNAAKWFARAATHVSPSTPTYLAELLSAGLGLCAIEKGNLHEARRRHEELLSLPSAWHYDPFTLLAFRARFLRCIGRRQEAVDLLDQEAAKLRDRLVLAWLKVRALQARILGKMGNRRLALSIAQEGEEVAIELCLQSKRDAFAILSATIRDGLR